jgi:MFS family permease
MRERLRSLIAVARPWVVGPVTVGHGVNEFLSIVFPPVIPLLVADFGISYSEAGFLLTVFFLMYLLFQLPAGILGDHIGQSRLIVVGLGAMAVGIGVAAVAETYGTLLVAQAIAGIGGSTFHPAGMSIISDVEGTGTEGRAMGVFGFGGAIGTMTAPVVVGGLAAVAGWRIALAGGAILALVVTLLGGPALLRARGAESPIPTTDGGRSRSTRDRLRSAVAAARFDVTARIVVLFCITLVLSMQARGVQTFTTAYVSAETGSSLWAGNFTFFTLLVGGSLASLWAGGLADRVDRARLGVAVSAATALLVAGNLVVVPLLSGLPTLAFLALLSGWFALIGVGVYAAYPVKNALVSTEADVASSGSLFGLIQTASAVGSAAGPAVFGVVATRWGVAAAFPSIALTGAALAGLFGLLGAVE